MRRNYHLFILLFPVVFWLICFFLLPLVSVFIYSFIERGTYGGVVWNFTPENYQRLFDGLYLGILWRSVSTALVCTASCLLLGYPFAYYLARYKPKHRNILLLLVVVPFWTNFLIRTYAWILILRTEGILNSLLGAVVPNWSPLELLNTPLAVQIGLVYGYLPFMILPLYAALEQLDLSLVRRGTRLRGIAETCVLACNRAAQPARYPRRINVSFYPDGRRVSNAGSSRWWKSELYR